MPLSQLSRSIEGSVAFITGAASGMGEATAKLFADQGAKVAIVDLNEEGLSRVASEIEAAGCEVKAWVLDLSDAAAIDWVIGEAAEHFGGLDLLVNNAGITSDNIMLRMKQDEWDDVIDTNLSSVYRMAKACLRGMSKGRWGRVVNISSVVGAMGNAGQANYAAAKAGMEGFTRAMAREFGSRNITVNAVAPGFIDTDMTKELPEANKEAMLAQIPAGRLGDPDEIAAAVEFLVSDSAGYITGATLPVNGGMYM